jgi:lipopolysaccharide export system permease protein
MADSGRMAFTPGGTDLYLTLRDGEVQEFKRSELEHFNRTFYTVNRIKVANVSNTFTPTGNDDYKGDREMTVCAMQEVVARARKDMARVQRDGFIAVSGELRRLVKVAPLPAIPEDTTPPRTSLYCQALGALKRLVTPTPAEAQEVRPQARPQPAGSFADARQAAMTAYDQRLRAARQRAAIYEVEIQKKLAISAACIIFALLGLPLAIRFPRGGVGLVIGTSLAVFSVYYVGLIGGEEFGDRLIVSPFLAMWAPNIIFLIVSIPLLWTVGRAGSSAHGGDWRDMKRVLFRWTGNVQRETGNV